MSLLIATFFHGLLTRSAPGIGGSRGPRSSNRSSDSPQTKVKLPDASYAKVSRLINRRLKRYDKNVRPNDTGRNICVRDMSLLP